MLLRWLLLLSFLVSVSSRFGSRFGCEIEDNEDKAKYYRIDTDTPTTCQLRTIQWNINDNNESLLSSLQFFDVHMQTPLLLNNFFYFEKQFGFYLPYNNNIDEVGYAMLSCMQVQCEKQHEHDENCGKKKVTWLFNTLNDDVAMRRSKNVFGSFTQDFKKTSIFVVHFNPINTYIAIFFGAVLLVFFAAFFLG